MKRFFPMAIILFFLANVIVLAKDYNYTEITGSKTVRTRLNVIKSDNNIEIRYENAGETHNVSCQENYATTSWSYRRPGEATELLLERDGNTIQVKGSLKGNSMQRTIKIDGSPWYQFASVSLTEFLQSSKANTYFWTIQPSNLKAYKMHAKKLGLETVELNGERIRAQHVKVSLTGLLSLFWSVDYWLRESDNAFIKFEGVNGPPGSPKTLIELEDE